MRAIFIPNGPHHMDVHGRQVLRLSYRLAPAARRRDRRSKPDPLILTDLTITRAEARAARILEAGHGLYLVGDE